MDGGGGGEGQVCLHSLSKCGVASQWQHRAGAPKTGTICQIGTSTDAPRRLRKQKTSLASPLSNAHRRASWLGNNGTLQTVTCLPFLLWRAVPDPPAAAQHPETRAYHQPGKGYTFKTRSIISPERQSFLDHHKESAWGPLYTSSAQNKTDNNKNQPTNQR